MKDQKPNKDVITIMMNVEITEIVDLNVLQNEVSILSPIVFGIKGDDDFGGEENGIDEEVNQLQNQVVHHMIRKVVIDGSGLVTIVVVVEIVIIVINMDVFLFHQVNIEIVKVVVYFEVDRTRLVVEQNSKVNEKEVHLGVVVVT